MTDPAIEAAQRAWDGEDPLGGVPYMPGDQGIWTPEAMEAAARAALKPVQDWFDCNYGMSSITDSLLDSLAPLIYPSEELNK